MLNLIIAAIGVLFVIITIYEFASLRGLKKEFQDFRNDLAAEHYRHQQAAHRIITAYGVKDPIHKIELIRSALERDDSVFNGYNSLGYAFLELGEYLKAADAFKDAVRRHPEDKAGYCDLAFAYLKLGDRTLCLDYLQQAIKVDSTAEQDILADSRFQDVFRQS